MGKKKKRKRMKARTVWTLLIGYLLIGTAFAIFYLGRTAPDATYAETAARGIPNAWALFPIVVMLWPVFLAVVLVQMLF